MAKTGPKNNYKLIDNTVRKLEQAFSIGATTSEACAYSGISRDTYYRWTKENPELSDTFARLRARPILMARKVVIDNLKDPKIAMWYLERKVADEFGMRSSLVGNKALKINIINYEME